MFGKNRRVKEEADNESWLVGERNEEIGAPSSQVIGFSRCGNFIASLNSHSSKMAKGKQYTSSMVNGACGSFE